MGLRCSGTNYLGALIQRNIQLTPTAELGWKHGFPTAQFVPSDVLVVNVFRHPLDWLRSFYRKPWHVEMPMGEEQSFSEFIRNRVNSRMDSDLWFDEPYRLMTRLPWNRAMMVPVRQVLRKAGLRLPARWLDDRVLRLDRTAEGQTLLHDRHPITGEPFATPMDMRTLKIRAALGWANRECACAFVQYEAVKADPEAFLERLAEAFSLRRKGAYEPVEEWMGEFSLGDRRSAPARIPEDDMGVIRAHLDLELERRLGYALPAAIDAAA